MRCAAPATRSPRRRRRVAYKGLPAWPLADAATDAARLRRDARTCRALRRRGRSWPAPRVKPRKPDVTCLAGIPQMPVPEGPACAAPARGKVLRARTSRFGRAELRPEACAPRSGGFRRALVDHAPHLSGWVAIVYCSRCSCQERQRTRPEPIDPAQDFGEQARGTATSASWNATYRP
jgi:hypothetical protein